MADLPRDNLVRAVFPADLELRDNGDATPTLHGHFAVFNTFTEIKSMFEGNFLERIAPGAFSKTIKENAANMRVLFQHGRDPQIGDKVLGVPSVLEEDSVGARYEVPLFDTTYNRDLEPGLRAGAYGASFRFQVVKEEIDQEPKRSDHNPDGLPERTIQEARVMEFGPVTFPAYADATAGVRSLTDDFLPGGRFAQGPDGHAERALADAEAIKVLVESGVAPDRMVEVLLDGKQIVEAVADRALTTEDTEVFNQYPVKSAKQPAEEASTTVEEEPTHSQEEASRDTPPADDRPTTTLEEKNLMDGMEEMRDRVAQITAELQEIASENTGRSLDAKTQGRWDALTSEQTELESGIRQTEDRQAYLEGLAAKPEHREEGAGSARVVANRSKPPEDPFDATEYHTRATSHEHLARLYTEGAHQAIERFHYPHSAARKQDVDGHLERLLRADSQDREIAQRFITMGSPTYRAGFWKQLQGLPLSREEQQAMAAGALLEARSVLTANTGGVTVPIQIDPTLIPVSNGVLNPFRLVSRNVTTTSYIWQGVTQAGITFTYRAEGATMADNAPTLVARPIQPERADAFIPFSWEVGQDWGSLEGQLAEAIQDGKDAAEATNFAAGAGHASNQPQGVLIGAGTLVGTSGGTALAVADVYALENALPPRYQANAIWLTTNAVGQRVRQLVAAAGPAQWGDSLAVGQPERLLGHPIYKASTVGTAGASLATTTKWGIIGDFSRYVIVDRIGLSIRVIDNLFAGNTAGGLSYPVGMSGVVAFYRNSAGVVDSNAFRTGTIT
jgi:HK97 family phage major capsid protein/HK97 family phage prohead protease